MASRLEWEDNDHTVCGRFAIQTERVRGEGAWHEVWPLTPEAKAAAVRLGLDLGTYNGKRAARAKAQRIADEILRYETEARLGGFQAHDPGLPPG